MAKVVAAYEAETGQVSEPPEASDEAAQAAAAALIVDEAAVEANLSEAEKLLRSCEAAPKPEQAEDVSILQAAVRAAERRVHASIRLVLDSPEDVNILAKDICDSMAAKATGDASAKSHVLIVLDGKLLCECGSQARLRLPPTRAAQVKRLLDSFMASRPESDLAETDVLLCLDGGKGGVGADWIHKSVVKHLPGKKYHILTHVVFYNQESVEKRMERASKNPLDLNENAGFVTADGPTDFKAAGGSHLAHGSS